MAYIDHATNTLHGGPEPTDYDDGTESMGQLCLKRLTEQGDFVILIDAATDEHVTSIQLRDRSIGVARALLANGVKAGDCISVCSPNRLEFAYVLFGTAFIGATLAPLNVTYTEDEHHHAVNLSKPQLIFVDEQRKDTIDSVARRNPFIKTVVQFGAAFKEFIGQHNDTDRPFVSEPQSTKENVVLIFCSSGTTGLSKGVQLTQDNVMVAVEQLRPQEEEKLYAPEQVNLNVLTWYHGIGCVAMVGNVINRRLVVFLPMFHDMLFLQTIPKYRINTIYLVPTLMAFLAKSSKVDNFDLSSLFVLWCGAAPLGAELETAVRKRLNLPVFRQGYGLTEATLAVCSQTGNHQTSGSVGVLKNGVQARVIDTKTGQALPANQTGELWIKGSIIMKGYVGNRRATEEAVDADGWLHTGDAGYYEETGELFIVDRLKELIKYKSFQVPPAEIEGLLMKHEDVMDAGVVGRPNEIMGELAVAFVVRRPGSEVNEEEIQKYVAERLSEPKQLHGGVRFVDAIPKNSGGKILRRELRALFD